MDHEGLPHFPIVIIIDISVSDGQTDIAIPASMATKCPKECYFNQT